MSSTRLVCAITAIAALLFACDPYTPPDGPDAGDDAVPADVDGGLDALDVDAPPGTATLTVTRGGGATGTVTSNPGGIACGATCAASFPVDTVITLSATAGAAADFIGWSGGGCTGTDPCVVTLSAATTVMATFDTPSYPVTVTLGGNGTGRVTASDLDCPGTCSTTRPSGSSLTLAAAPSAGSIFTGWSGACTGTGTCAVTVTAATDVVANFALNQTLIVAKSGTGTGAVSSAPAGIDCGVDCNEMYAPGTIVTLTATADADSIFTGWTGGGCSGTGTCAVTVNASVQVTAGFMRRRLTLTVDPTGAGAGTITSSPAGIDCGADCSELYDVGTVVTLTASPAVGAQFLGWSGGGCFGTAGCVVTIGAATTVTADFAPILHTLSVARGGTGAGSVTSSPAGITCGADCSEDYPQGTMVTLAATPAAGSTFGGWSGGCTGAGACNLTVGADVSVVATFTLVPYALTVATAGTGAGTVTSTPAGINCGADCSEPYVAGTVVTLTAAPAAGSTFTGWSGAGCSGTGTCVVTVSGAAMVTASFTLQPFSLTVAKSGSGAGTITSAPAGISCGADCSETYPFGTVVTLTTAPAAGSTFAGWSGGGCTGLGTCVVTIGAATTVSATFTANQYLLSAGKSGAGAGTITSAPSGISCGADCSEPYDHGTVITLTATPSAGSTFGGWSGGGCSGTGTCVVTLTAATSVVASFTLDPFSLTVTRMGLGTGTVTSAPAGIACGTDCTEAYANGTVVTLTATPSTGSTFLGWSGAGCTGTGTCVVTISSAVTVVASFAVIDYALTVARSGTGSGTVSSAPAGIACGADCSELVGYGGSMTLTAAPSAGSTFTGWSGGGCSGTGSCVVTVTAATTITAQFTLDTPALTVAKTGTGSGTVTSSPTGINCGADCSEAYGYGTAVTLTASASTGSTFTGWSGGGCSGTGGCVVTVTAATNVNAQFTINTYTLSVTKAGSGAGTVTSSPTGISCGADCLEPYSYGTSVTLTASASTGSTFTGWSGGGCSGTGGCTVTVTANTTVTATFAPTPYTLTISKPGSGAGTVTSSPSGLSCGATCAASYNYGTSIALTASASTGSTFTGWSGGGCSGTGSCTVTLTATTTVTANFTINTYLLSVSKAGTGAGTVTSSPTGVSCGTDCSQSYNYNTPVTLTAAASTGSTFGGWSGGGCTGTGTCIVTMTAATTVSATFTAIPYTLTVAKAGTGAGTVTSSPAGISCGATCAASFNYNTSVALTAAASTGSTFAGWSGGGCTGTSTCTVTMTAATTVSATFTAIPYTLTVAKAGTGAGTVTSSPAGISCGTTCAASFNYNTSVALTAAASTGSTFAGWSGGGCTGTGMCAVALTAAITVTATFTALPLLTVQPWGSGVGNVTASPTGINCGVGGGGGSDCTEYYPVNTSVTLTVSVAAGSVFTGWSNGCTGTATTCTTTMSASKTVRATIEANRTLGVSITGSGSVASSPSGISCGGTCSATYLNGTLVTLTATADGHGAFVGWTGACSGSSTTCIVTMDAAKNVGATFLYVLTLWAAGEGHINVSAGPACAWAFCYYAVAGGTFVSYTAIADPGYHFATWNNNNNTCTGQGSVCTFTVGPTTPLVEAGAFSAN